MKKILILGASSDIGQVLTQNYLNKNYNVIAHYNKNPIKFKKIKHKNLTVFNFDLKKIVSFEKFVNKNKLFNDIDTFISLTGYLKIVSYEKTSIKEIYDHINVNYLSNYLITKRVINFMKRKGYGRIVYASSIGTKFGGSDNSFIYSLSKFMNEFYPRPYRNLTKNNILINTLQIGLTDTKLNKIDKNKNMKNRIKLIPLGRMATIGEVVYYLDFLASNKNTLIANETINISGGE